MTDNAPNRHLEEVLVAYREAMAAGWAPDRHLLLRCYPNLADALEHFFATNPVGNRTLTRAPDESTAPDQSSQGSPHIPGYEVVGELGRGGMGVVYKALQVKAGRLVALKMILTGTHAGSVDHQRFLSEGRAVAQLQHPNIVQVYEVGEHLGLPFFSMEICEGGSLADHLDGTPLPPPVATELVQHLARAVQACHERHIIHRDLKPANILLSVRADVPAIEAGSLAAWTPKVTDFGLAKDLDAASRTASNAIVGTPSYMAPEQAGSKRDQIGPATDVYALGTILYEVLTGRPPFKGPTPVDTILQVLGDEPVPPSRLLPKLPRDLETICLKCLRKEPSKRYASARDLADDLERFQRGEPVRARPLGRAARVWRWCRRNPVVAGLLLAIFLVLAAGTSVASYFAVTAAEKATQAEISSFLAWQQQQQAEAEKLEAQKQERRAELARYAMQMDLARREFQTDQLDFAGRLLSECSPDCRGWEYQFLQDRIQRKLRTITSHPDMVRSVSFSPDGKRLASASAAEIRICDVVTGNELLRLAEQPRSIQSVAFSPDGRLLAGNTGSLQAAITPNKPRFAGEVRLWDAETGRLLHRWTRPTGFLGRLAFSPDGKNLVAGNADATASIWETATGRLVRTLTGHRQGVSCVACSPDGKHLATGSVDGVIKVWDASTGDCVRTLQAHTSFVFSVAFAGDSGRLASASLDRTVRHWYWSTGQQLHSLQEHQEKHRSVGYFDLINDRLAFRPNTGELASGTNYGSVQIWDSRRGQQVQLLQSHREFICSTAFSPDGRLVASGGSDRQVRIWDLTVSLEPRTVASLGGDNGLIGFLPSGHYLVLGGERQIISVVDAQTKRPLLTLPARQGQVGIVAVDPDGKRLATATMQPPEAKEPKGSVIQVWDTTTWKPVREIHSDLEFVMRGAFSPDGNRLVLGGGKGKPANRAPGQTKMVESGEVLVLEIETGVEVMSCKGHTDLVTQVLCSPDGRTLISAGADRAVRLWDARTGESMGVLEGHTGPVFTMALSPDGMRLAGGGSAGDPNTAAGEFILWDLPSRAVLATNRTHELLICSVVFSPDGSRAVTAGIDGLVKVWDATAGQNVLTLPRQPTPLFALTFSADGKKLLGGRVDGNVVVWEMDPPPDRR